MHNDTAEHRSKTQLASAVDGPLLADSVSRIYVKLSRSQRITPEGWQEAAYAPFSITESPIRPALTPSGGPCKRYGGGRNRNAAVRRNTATERGGLRLSQPASPAGGPDRGRPVGWRSWR